ncbi:Stealth CR1 domain-containing protein [Levilactobacillus tujiorum]|uniref:Stealth CR1 domain-containing protein n=1 Tax=Levilactobacillus tujiorum TaxID=2912243 RepID=UPI001456C7C3|nr:capsule biosynthesis protein CapG [Levilactobacillus tujiorum]
MKSIDFVIPWVDGSDLQWLEKKELTRKSNLKVKQEDLLDDADTENRYRDYGALKYLLRSIDKFAPWVNHIFLVTDHQKPDWLNVKGKIRIIDHSEIIEHQYLPTFNSNAIELNAHKIPGLSENFVLFNDDFLLNAPVQPEDFFRDDHPVDAAIFHPIFPESDFDRIKLNCVMVINQHFKKREVERKNFLKIFNIKYKKMLIHNMLAFPYSRIMGFYDFHLPIAYTKEEFRTVWQEEPSLLRETVSHKFRSNTDISHWVIRYWRLMTGDFVTQSLPFGKYFNMGQVHSWSTALSSKVYKAVCINDIDDLTNATNLQDVFDKKLEEKFPDASSWEL